MKNIKEKQYLINGLQQMIDLMVANAAHLHKLYPELNHHNELMGAAKLVQDWVDNIEDEFN